MRPRDENDPELEPELAEVARLLDEAARQEQRDVAAGTASARAAPGTAHFDQTTQRLWEEADRRRVRARRTRTLGLVSAAAALVLAVVLVRGSGDPDRGGELLGEHDLRVLSPVGTVRSWGTIEWSGPGGPYVLRVLAAETRAPLLGPLRLVEPRYTPAPEESARWPEEIVIEIERRLPDGTPERTTAEARLAP